VLATDATRYRVRRHRCGSLWMNARKKTLKTEL